MDSVTKADKKTVATANGQKRKAPYAKPSLERFGRISDFTLGFSSPQGESGIGDIRMPTPPL